MALLPSLGKYTPKRKRPRGPSGPMAILQSILGGAGASTGSPFLGDLYAAALRDPGGAKAMLSQVNAQYNPAINALTREYGMAGAQSAQNVADIGSWLGQIGGDMKASAKSNRKAERANAKEQKNFDATVLAAIGDPNVQRSLAVNSDINSDYMGDTNTAEAQFDNRMQSDIARQGAYQKLVQQRLGAQMQSEIAAKLADAHSARSSARQSARSSAEDKRFERLLALAQFAESTQEDPMDQMMKAMGIYGTGQKLGLPGFPQPEPEVDPSQMFSLLGGIFDQGQPDDAGEARTMAEQALGAFGLPPGPQSNRMIELLLNLRDIDPKKKDSRPWWKKSALDIDTPLPDFNLGSLGGLSKAARGWFN